MSPALRLLVVEDAQADFLLAMRALEQEGLRVEGSRVDRMEDLYVALEGAHWDAVLSDYTLPGMVFREVLAAVQAADSNLPVLLLSGSVGEEEAVDLLHLGVRDYVLKDRPGRLPTALRNALEEARVRRGRQAAEAALRSSEERSSAVFQASPIATVLVRAADLVILDANPAFEELSGHGLEDLRGRTTGDLAFWVRPEEHARVRDLILGGRSLRQLEMTFRRASGATGRAELSTEEVRLGGERVLVGFFLDVTATRAAQENERQMAGELNHLQRLESIGRLASGISHDMNNVLGAILAVAELLAAENGDRPKVVRSAEAILKAGGRGRALVKGLTDFARKDIRDAVPLDLNALVRREAELLERTTFRRVALRLELQEPLPLVLGEASALGNVLMNLCVNACDAMPRGGTLRLATRVREDGRVELVVADTGEGMSPEVLARAMEPFFTTKPQGQGTGLGLSIVYGTVKALGGAVELQSQPGQGTRVAVSFPPFAVGPPVPEAPGPPAETASRPRRILLVDDDELILETVPPMLHYLGHQVETASSGQEALRRLEAGLEAELVILDLNMPGLSGLETLARLRILRPELPVLVASGQQDAAVLAHARAFPLVEILGKPFLLADLRLAIEQVAWRI